MTKEHFKDKFSEEPRKDDLTVLAPKQDDPTEQVRQLITHQYLFVTPPCWGQGLFLVVAHAFRGQ